jgi:hypothetical protein
MSKANASKKMTAYQKAVATYLLKPKGLKMPIIPSAAISLVILPSLLK